MLNFIETRLSSISGFQCSDVYSPYYGLFDYTYWRDKKSFCADTRFQEVVLAFAYIKPKSVDYKNIIFAAIDAIQNLQNSDGSFNEWYNNDKSMAATAYMGVTVLHLAALDEYSAQKPRLHNIAKKVASYMMDKNDLVKINHQSTIIYFFALCEKYGIQVASIDSYSDLIFSKVALLFSKIDQSGWFHEVAEKDIGYTFLLLDYLCLTNSLKKYYDDTFINELFQKASAFLTVDLMVDKRLSFAYNGYVSPFTAAYLAEKSKLASSIIEIFKTKNAQSIQNYSMDYLNDDFRFCRWAGFVCHGYEVFKDNIRTAPKIALDVAKELIFDNEHISSDLSLISKKYGKYKVFVSHKNGGFIQISTIDETIYRFYGVTGRIKKPVSTLGYSNNMVTVTDSGLALQLNLRRTNFFQPTIYTMALISLICKCGICSIILRKFVDIYRARIKSTLNQSNAPIQMGNTLGVVNINVDFSAASGLKITIVIPERLSEEKLHQIYDSTNLLVDVVKKKSYI